MGQGGFGNAPDIPKGNDKISLKSLEEVKIPDLVKPLLETPELGPESMLFSNDIFHGINEEDLTNITFLEKLLNDKLSVNAAYSKIEKIDGGVLITSISRPSEFKKYEINLTIKILKKKINSKITRNFIVVQGTESTMALNKNDKWFLINFFIQLRETHGFIINYESDNFKIEKNKTLRNDLKWDFEVYILNLEKAYKKQLQIESNTIEENEIVQDRENRINDLDISYSKKKIQAVSTIHLSTFSAFYKQKIDQRKNLELDIKGVKEGKFLPGYESEIVPHIVAFNSSLKSANIKLKNAELTLNIFENTFNLNDINDKIDVILDNGKMVQVIEKVGPIEKHFNKFVKLINKFDNTRGIK